MSEDAMTAIKDIEDKYGLVLFGMALAHLVDVGARHLDAKSIAAAIDQLVQEEALAVEPDKIRVLPPAMQCKILRCAGELATFSICDLFEYIKYHFYFEETEHDLKRILAFILKPLEDFWYG